MTIEALPTNTVRIIGSTQSLTDACSVVKELIENAIDANAKAVFVEISKNSIDKIQVKDNGHGVAPDDRKLVCTRYCTSKIRDFADLRNIGGHSLGFRGEALASAVALSGGLKLTTRVEGETTAMECCYDTQCTITSEKRVSHPVGTTVSIADFLKGVPVRRQTASKDQVSATQLANIQRLLQVYSLSRPHMRFSLKVLNAKSDKVNFSYTPSSRTPAESDVTASVRESIGKIFGAKLAEHYQPHTWASYDGRISPQSGSTKAFSLESSRCPDFEFQALVPRAETNIELSMISPPRQFIYVDLRPVSASKGIFKQIASSFKKHYKSAASRSGVHVIPDTFLYLNIRCRRGLYDVNAEPAKDDVLFEDPTNLLVLIDKFFTHMYGEQRAEVRHCTPVQRSNKVISGNVLLARERPAYVAAQEDGEEARSQQTSPITRLHTTRSNQPETQCHDGRSPGRLARGDATAPDNGHHRSGKLSMYNGDEYYDCLEAHEDGQDLLSDHLEDLDEAETNDITVSNPWAIAKFNAAFRQPSGTRFSATTFTPDRCLPTSRGSGEDSFPSPDRLRPGLQLPEMQSPNALSSPLPFPFPLRVRGKRQQADTTAAPDRYDGGQQQASALDSWVQQSSGRSNNSDIEQDHRRTSGDGFVPAQSRPLGGTPLSTIPNICQKPRKNPANHKQKPDALYKPFVSPVHDPEKVWFETGEHRANYPKKTQRAHTNNFKALNLRESSSSSPTAQITPSTSPIHPDLAATLDYEGRKAQATLDYKTNAARQLILERQKATINDNLQATTPPSSSPHRNRYLAAKAALQAASTSAPAIGDQGASVHFLAPTDPRALLLRQQEREASVLPQGKRSRRAKTITLPLETIPQGECVRELLLQLSVDIGRIEEAMGVLEGCDEFISKDEIGGGLEQSGEKEMEGWKDMVRTLLNKRQSAVGSLGWH